MGVEVSEQRDSERAEPNQRERFQKHRLMATNAPEKPEEAQSMLGQLKHEIQSGLHELQWREILLLGIGGGLLMPLSFLQAGVLSFTAGIIPVGAGLLIGRRVKGHYGLQGFVAGLVGALVSFLFLGGLIFLTPLGAGASSAINPSNSAQLSPIDIWLQLGGFIALSMLTFCPFGASMAGRTEQRNRQMREEIEQRGGQLERPNTVRNADDIRGMSLPQFGSYINTLFKKQGFTLKDYRFIDKDKHLDLWMEYEGEPWHLRLSVADKVAPGTIEGLNQELKRERCRKGIVITSTEFQPGALKSAKGRPIVLIDGLMLYEIAEK